MTHTRQTEDPKMIRFNSELKLVLFLFFIQTSYALDLSRELCFDGKIDASFSTSKSLYLFKRDVVYEYSFEPISVRSNKIQLNNQTNTTIYEQLLSKSEIQLKLKSTVSFSEFCPGNEFKLDRIRTAFYNDGKAYLFPEGKC